MLSRWIVVVSEASEPLLGGLKDVAPDHYAVEMAIKELVGLEDDVVSRWHSGDLVVSWHASVQVVNGYNVNVEVVHHSPSLRATDCLQVKAFVGRSSTKVESVSQPVSCESTSTHAKGALKRVNVNSADVQQMIESVDLKAQGLANVLVAERQTVAGYHFHLLAVHAVSSDVYRLRVVCKSMTSCQLVEKAAATAAGRVQRPCRP